MPKVDFNIQRPNIGYDGYLCLCYCFSNNNNNNINNNNNNNNSKCFYAALSITNGLYL